LRYNLIDVTDCELNLKKTISSENRSKKSNKKQCPKMGAQASSVLKTATDQEAFRFYEAIGRPTGQIARNLPEFLERAKLATTQSIVFHLGRRDFQNWIETTLGDTELAKELEKLLLSRDNFKTDLCRTVENRIRDLTCYSTMIKADEKATAILSSPL
jgi:hypothetical protein